MSLLTSLLWWIGGGLLSAAVLYYVIWVPLVSTRIKEIEKWLTDTGMSPLVKGLWHLGVGILLVLCGAAVLLHKIAETLGRWIKIVPPPTPVPPAAPTTTPPPGATP